MPSAVTLGVNGTVKTLENVDPSLKLSAYLRDDCLLRGTKVACGEGGCGACAVLLSRWDSASKTVVTISANACLRPVVLCHGWHITTVEGIGGPTHDAGYHAIQQRFKHLNASQCGFCTPGFVVSMYAQMAKKSNSNMLDIESCLDGNLCRCTGYRPIMDACKSFAVDSDITDRLGGCDLSHEALDLRKEIEARMPKELKDITASTAEFSSVDGKKYIRVGSVADAVKALQANPGAVVACAQTSAGIFKDKLPNASVIVDVSTIPELNEVKTDGKEGLVLGAATPLNAAINVLATESGARDDTAFFQPLSELIGKIAGQHVRNVGSIVGNLMMAKEWGFPSDLATPLCAVGTLVNFHSAKAGASQMPLLEFLAKPTAAGDVVVVSNIVIPFSTKDLFCYRTAIRTANAHPIVNAAYFADIAADGVIQDVSAVYGGVGNMMVAGECAPTRAKHIEDQVRGKTLSKRLGREVVATLYSTETDIVSGEYRPEHRRRLVRAFFVKFVADARGHCINKSFGREESVLHVAGAQRDVHTSDQKYTYDDAFGVVGKAIPRLDGERHASGSATYISDIKEEAGTLHAAWVITTVPCGKIKSMEIPKAMAMRGVRRFITYKDLPKGAMNVMPAIISIMGLKPNETNGNVFCDGDVTHSGQGIGLILADTQTQAIAASKVAMREITYDTEGTTPIITVKDAKAAGKAPCFKNEVNTGDLAKAQADPKLSHIDFECYFGSQKHFYMETHAVYVVPRENNLTIYSPTQGAAIPQLLTAITLGKKMNELRIVHYRIGGSFGGKALPHNSIAVAVAALAVNAPVKMHMDRNTDMQMQGGREETDARGKISFDDNGRIHGYDMAIERNSGSALELTVFGLMIAIPRSINTMYTIPSMKLQLEAYITNLSSRTATRAPGEIESGIITEAVMDQIAHKLNVHSQVVREANFMRGDPTCKKPEQFTFPSMYNAMMEGGWKQRILDSIEFNEENALVKRGVAVVPYRYGVGVQESNASINIYDDGSVVVQHSGTEMGQGILTKITQACAHGLSKVGAEVSLENIRCAGNDTDAMPNYGMTGGSTGSESSCASVLQAAARLVEVLKPVAESLPEEQRKVWPAIVMAARKQGLPLYAGGYQKGNSANYFIYLVAGVEVEVDVLTGVVSVERVEMKYDCAQSLNPAIDIGQAEGAFMMGLGYMLLEEAEVDPKTGWLHNDGTFDYKIPCAFDTPKHFSIELINNKSYTEGIMSSKASGEPPLCVAPAIISAVRQCVNSARAAQGLTDWVPLNVPVTSDKIAIACGLIKNVLGGGVEHPKLGARFEAAQHVDPAALGKEDSAPQNIAGI